MISVKVKGNFKKIEGLLYKARYMNPYGILSKYGELGVEALSSATPIDSGKTSRSWYYEIGKEGDAYVITYLNSNVTRGINIAIILDEGHATGTGGYVRGRNYIKPAIRPIFDQIAAHAWKEVTDA